MRHLPILYSAPMVHAIQRDVDPKTQTRRLCRMDRPLPWIIEHGFQRYGDVGDYLWVRETWALVKPVGEPIDQFDDWDSRSQPKRLPTDRKAAFPWRPIYRADDGWDVGDEEQEFRWRPSIHMPRWASRITLEVTSDIRVEHLTSISEVDAKSEGVDPCSNIALTLAPRPAGCAFAHGFASYVCAYAALWDKINGDRVRWSENPLVYAITFRRIEARNGAD